MKKLAFFSLFMTAYANRALAVTNRGGLGDNFIAAVVSSAQDVWVPALLFLGFVVVVANMFFGFSRFLTKFGMWVMAIIVVGGAWQYISSLSGGAVSMTFILR